MGKGGKNSCPLHPYLTTFYFILGDLYKIILIFQGREDIIYSCYDNIHAGEYIECCTEIPKIAVKLEQNTISGWYLNTVWTHMGQLLRRERTTFQLQGLWVTEPGSLCLSLATPEEELLPSVKQDDNSEFLKYNMFNILNHQRKHIVNK